jgi:hypothetical protein
LPAGLSSAFTGSAEIRKTLRRRASAISVNGTQGPVRHYHPKMGTYGVEEANEHEDATARMRTGIYGQTLNIDGWFASHADTSKIRRGHLNSYPQFSLVSDLMGPAFSGQLFDG